MSFRENQPVRVKRSAYAEWQRAWYASPDGAGHQVLLRGGDSVTIPDDQIRAEHQTAVLKGRALIILNKDGSLSILGPYDDTRFLRGMFTDEGQLLGRKIFAIIDLDLSCVEGEGLHPQNKAANRGL